MQSEIPPTGVGGPFKSFLFIKEVAEVLNE